MADRPASDTSGEADLAGLARDWITIWQSELSALASDREGQETWRALLQLWADAARMMLAAISGQHDGTTRRSGTHAAPRATAAAAAPDARDAEIARLSRLVRDLESRLADLERQRG
ncbi:MAG: hypothetical protein ACREF3_07690 [Acetobacteraceae bacterium]